MKKIFFMLALVVASMGMANASNVSTDIAASEVASTNSSVDGVYAGTATPTKMNGHAVQDPTPVDATFTIEDGYLEGSVSVATAGHSFNIYSTSAITGAGSYTIAGTFQVSSLISLPITGTVTITTVDGTDLEFTCTAYVGGSSATESVFSFTTK